MAETTHAKSLKAIEERPEPYHYLQEILPEALKRQPFKPEDVDRLGHSANQIGMGKIRAKTSAGKYVVEFLNKSTIHGLNHISAPHRHSIERCVVITLKILHFSSKP